MSLQYPGLMMKVKYFYGTISSMNTDQLQAHEMDEHLKNGTFRLAFVGMSNAGKSYRSRVLQNELDFFWYEVDANIQGALGIDDMDEISDWLGYPTQDTYQERQREYLAAEEQCTHLEGLDTEGKNLVFDTTGSVIYLSDVAKGWLHEQCLVVNIDVGEDSLDEMVEKYFTHPKPVIWGDAYQPQDGESEEEALRRCYPELLRTRLKAYRDFAHVTIPVTELYDTDAKKTLEVIKQYL